MIQPLLNHFNSRDIVDYLASIGLKPAKQSGDNYYYPSPFVAEPTIRLKVNRTLNTWWHPRIGGGSLADFAVRYYDCTIRELIENLSGITGPVPQRYPLSKADAEQRIIILDTHSIRSLHLLQYLWERRIPLHVAQRYYTEVIYTFGPTPFSAIGIASDAGGFELYDKYHRYSIPPHSPTHLDHQSEDVVIARDPFDALTLIAFMDPTNPLPDFVILYRPSSFEDILSTTDSYRNKFLLLGNDPTGDRLTAIALHRDNSYRDLRSLHSRYPMLNDWAFSIGKGPTSPRPDPHGKPPA